MRAKVISAIVLFIAVLALDQWSKGAAQNLPPIEWSLATYPYGGVPLFYDFFGIQASLVNAFNRGAAWGIFADYSSALLVLRIALIGAMVVYLFFFNRCRKNTLPLALLIAGATGNVIDYFRFGHVIDMIKVVLWGYHFPIFNIADTFITISIAWLILNSFRSECRDIHESA